MMIDPRPSLAPHHAHGPRVIVGMSGGVDSSVAALLLQRQGYQVSGVYMKNWEEHDPDFPCSAVEDARDALDVCERLGLELEAINFVSLYWDRVFEYFLAEHRLGRTPNPDVLCNKEIKFKAFLERAFSLGADYIATGHYARVRVVSGEYQLLKARDAGKDQTYFLYTLGQEQLSRSLFPIGEFQKPDIRALAAQAGLSNATKKDSTGICFIGERNFSQFLSRYLPAQAGEIRDTDGALLGHHRGLMYYTIGQRKGLGVGGRHGAEETPWYVADKALATNTLTVVQGHDHPRLFSHGLLARDWHWVSGTAPPMPFSCLAKTRYRQPDQACTVSENGDGRYRVIFVETQRAVTPGQSVVFYNDDQCLGGAVIDELVR